MSNESLEHSITNLKKSLNKESIINDELYSLYDSEAYNLRRLKQIKNQLHLDQPIQHE